MKFFQISAILILLGGCTTTQKEEPDYIGKLPFYASNNKVVPATPMQVETVRRASKTIGIMVYCPSCSGAGKIFMPNTPKGFFNETAPSAQKPLKPRGLIPKRRSLVLPSPAKKKS